MNTVQESDQVVQRRANLEELKKLGVDPYPHRFEVGTTIDAIVAAYGTRSAEALEAAQAHVRTAGRILAIRNFGKANFLVISDGRARVQVYAAHLFGRHVGHRADGNARARQVLRGQAFSGRP